MNALQTIEQDTNTPAPRQAVTTFDMINQAVANGASIEMMEKLLALHERFEQGQARRAFDAAISEAKAEIKPVAKNKTGHNKTRYADFSALASAVDPVLASKGLSYRFRTKQDSSGISVTCVLSHRDGHSEENTLTGPADGSGSKNAIQAIGSTLTYLQRYSLVQALGIAASDDDDGKSASGPVEYITEDQIGELLAALESKGRTAAGLCKVMQIDRLADMPASRFQEACNRVSKAAEAAR